MDIREIELDKLKDYREHNFPFYDKKRLDGLSESIKTNGVLTPIIVQNLDTHNRNFEILAGHNRVRAARLAGLKTIPAVVVIPHSDEEAKLIVYETNINQRGISELSLYDKCHIIKQWYELIKSQGRRTDLLDEIERLEVMENYEEKSISDFENLSCVAKEKKLTAREFISQRTGLSPYTINQYCHIAKQPSNPYEINGNSSCVAKEKKLTARDFISQKTGLSPYTINQYCRIAKLPKDLVDKVDLDMLPLESAYELSFVDEETNKVVCIQIENIGLKVPVIAAKKIRQYCKGGKKITNINVLNDIIFGGKIKKLSYSIKEKTLTKYFSGTTPKKEIAAKVEYSLELTENIIPRILKENNIAADDYTDIVTAAIEKYAKEKNENER